MLKDFVTSLNKSFQIIGLTETWLNDINKDNFNLPGFDYIGSNRENKRGEGVGMYVSKQLQYKTRNDISINVENRIETSFIEICTSKGNNVIVGTIYRPPINKIDTLLIG
jgi:exonuclease III